MNNANLPYSDKYQGHNVCNYGNKVVCIDDIFSNLA